MAQADTISRPLSPRAILFVGFALAAVIAVAAGLWWLPQIGARLAAIFGGNDANLSPGVSSTAEQEDDHGHEHAGHDDPNVLELSAQARRNIGLKIGPVEIRTYDRKLSIPGIVVEREGRSTHAVSAPLTGIVTRVYVTEGQAVTPGEKLFDLRLTHEDVVQAQADYLRTSQELDIIGREVKRLEAISDGVIAGKTLLQRQYEQEKQEVTLRSQREALLLHGLSEAQVDGILRTGKLLASLTVTAPDHAHGDRHSGSVVFQVQELNVDRGHHVATGEMLAVLTDHEELLIEGRAFEQDAPSVAQAMTNKWPVDAMLESAGGEPVLVSNLDILFVGSRVDPESRALHFYVRLPNELIYDAVTNDRRHVMWRFNPGQRMQIRVPVEKWPDRIVLPIDAIAQDGVETYVFRENGQHLVRQPVQVEFRDPTNAVIANDGSLYPGDRVAMNAAHQLLVALKNKSGGGVDPHAGHSH